MSLFHSSTPLPSRPMTDREKAYRLWALLDDIDTMDDACHNDDAAFRVQVRRIQKKRHQIMHPDEWDVIDKEVSSA